MQPALRQILFGSGALNLNAFTAGQSDGVWYDFTKPDRLLTADIGPTNVASVGDSIGLALDQRTWNGQTLAQVLAAASELFAFNSGSATGWTAGDSAILSTVSNALRITGNGVTTFPKAYKTFSATSGKLYKVIFQYSMVSGGTTFLNINPAGVIGSGDSTYQSSSNTTGTLTAYVVATGTAITVAPVVNTATGVLDVQSISCKLIPGYAATQSTSSLRGTYQTTGDKFDGSDDNLLTGYLAGSGANFIGARTTVPATLAATQVILGASGASANRIFLGINTSGLACGGIGSDSTTTIVGTSDLRSTEAKVFLTCDGTTVRLIVNGVVEYSAAQNSTPTTTIPLRLGCNNNNGTAGSFYGGTARWLMAGRQFITASQAVQIGNQA